MPPAGAAAPGGEGGYSARYDGSPYSPLHRAGGLLCTPDEESWHRAACRGFFEARFTQRG